MIEKWQLVIPVVENNVIGEPDPKIVIALFNINLIRLVVVIVIIIDVGCCISAGIALRRAIIIIIVVVVVGVVIHVGYRITPGIVVVIIIVRAIDSSS